MAGPSFSTCSPWATIDDLCDPCLSNYDTLDPTLLDRMLQISSDLLFELSGRRFPGLCTATVRPCSQRVFDSRPVFYSTHRPTPSCGCTALSKCGCPSPSEISLGVEPIVSVEEVKVDGEVLDPSLYRVDDYRVLVRLRDSDGSYASWPCCQDVLLPDTESGTFSVSFTYGNVPPLAGIHAAAVYACELALACSPIDGVECRLPKRVQNLTRQGVSMVMIDPMEFLAQGRLGIVEADNFLAAYNPNHLTRSASVLSPDIAPRVRRVNTGGA